jgi:SAM-dependent methyltransferase
MDQGELSASNAAAIESFSDEVVGHLTGAALSAMIFIGDRLGLYKAMQDAGWLTSETLAHKAGYDERWVREWLHSQASAGLVAHRAGGDYRLTPDRAAVLADESSEALLVGGFSLVLPLLQSFDRIERAFKTGRGVPYDGLGTDHAVGEARFSGPWMRANLVSVVVPALGDVKKKLENGGKAADVGCGSGQALIELARAFPNSEFHGYDSSKISIDFAKDNAEHSGLTNIVLHHAAAEQLPPDGTLDFVMTWDSVHDMTDPPAAMKAVRRALKDDGAWLIVDINGRATPEQNFEEPLSGLLYAISVLDCLNCSTCKEGAMALGTLGFPEHVAKDMTGKAGFSNFRTHDFGNPVNSFFEVRP